MKLSVILTVLLLLLALTACNGDYDGTTATTNGGTTLEMVMQNPESFVTSPPSELSLTGLATNVTPQFFYIQCQTCDCNSELMVDFRGTQAFPQAGENITVIGQLVQNCCNPNLFMLRSFQYETNGQ